MRGLGMEKWGNAWDGEGASADECRGAQEMVRWTTETAERDERGRALGLGGIWDRDGYRSARFEAAVGRERKNMRTRS